MLQSKVYASEFTATSAESVAVRFENAPPRRRIDSGRLLNGARELVIEHAGGEYHLRLTRNDKLILTK